MNTDTPQDHTTDQPSTEERILHAAITLIQQHGLGSVTMSQIAETAGVARQTLYNHHTDVDSIIVAAFQQHNAESLRLLRLSLQTAPTPTDRIEQLVRHFVVVGSQAHGTPDLRDGLSTDARTTIDTYRTEVRDIIRDTLQHGVETGEFRSDIDLPIDSHLIYATLEMLQNLAAATPHDAASITTAGIRTTFTALRAQTSSRP